MKNETHNSAIFKGILSVTALVIIGAVVVFIFQILPTLVVNKGVDIPSVVLNKSPSSFGELYLTLSPKSGGATDSYVFDLESNKMRLIKDASNPSDYLSMFNYFSGNGVSSTFFGITKEDFDNSIDNVTFDLFYSKEVNKNVELVSKVVNPQSSATIAIGDESILFASRTNIATDRAPQVEDWTIYLATKEEGKWNTQPLWNGSSPQWISSNLFYYLKNDGIYIGIAGVKKEELVWSTDGVLGGNSHITLSKDKKKLSWTLPDTGKVLIFSSKYDEEEEYFVLSPDKSIKVNAFWSVFSPDSSKIALQAVNWDTLITNPNSRIEIYSINGEVKKISEIDLNDFIQTSMFLTDWR